MLRFYHKYCLKYACSSNTFSNHSFPIVDLPFELPPSKVPKIRGTGAAQPSILFKSADQICKIADYERKYHEHFQLDQDFFPIKNSKETCA